MYGDCRASATMCRTGTTGDSNGPTVFVMKGERSLSGFTDQYIVERGCTDAGA